MYFVELCTNILHGIFSWISKILHGYDATITGRASKLNLRGLMLILKFPKIMHLEKIALYGMWLHRDQFEF